MVGDVLGAPHEGERAYRLPRMFPRGLTDFWHFARTGQPEPYGHYTGDFGQLLGVARSLVAAKGADTLLLAQELARAYQPGQRRYTPYTSLVLDGLSEGANALLVSRLADNLLDLTSQRNASTSSDLPEREPYGPQDYGSAVRIAPVGLAFRDMPPEALAAAVNATTLLSHPHPAGHDGAAVQAAAVAWLSRSDPQDEDCQPGVLLDYLVADVANTKEMRQLLLVISRAYFELELVSDWRDVWPSTEWATLVRTHNQLTHHGYATLGTQAAAVALWVLCCNWRQPEQAVILAATLGGNAPAVAGMTGALAGALHGRGWLPARWLDALEDGEEGGKAEVARLARELASLDATEQQEGDKKTPPGLL